MFEKFHTDANSPSISGFLYTLCVFPKEYDLEDGVVMSHLKWKLGLSVVLLLIVFVTIFFISHSHQSNSQEWEKVIPSSATQKKATSFVSKKKSQSVQSPQASNKPAKTVMVDIKGAVNHPGVFSINEGSRVVDALKLAGGVTSEADPNQINLAQHVTDEMVIFVPKKGEAPPASLLTGGNGQTPTGESSGNQTGAPMVHLNSASLTDLETLPGIGPSKAQAIFDYRTKNGPFHTLDDLKNVTGIGDKSFERIRPQLILN
jgi:competence protein ComEA